METYRGPVALTEIETAIGPFEEAIVSTNGRRTLSLRVKDAVGYAWNCGCEARGNASPFCVWQPCEAHVALAAGIAVHSVPAGYEAGRRVKRQLVKMLEPGEVFVPAESAVARGRAAGASLGFVQDGNVMREYPDGRREVVSSL